MATISKAEVVSIIEHGTDVREYIFKLEKNNYFDPGTFLQLTLETNIGNRWPESRNFSIASAPNKEGLLRLIIGRVGVYTARIFNELTVGKTCTFKYSFGDFLIPSFDSKGDIICIAGGTGIAPFLSFAEYLNSVGQSSRMKLFYSTKNSSELIGIDLFKKLLPAENLHFHLTREQKDGFKNGRITIEDIVSQKFNYSASHFYICGGESFTKGFKEELSKLGAEAIYTDEW